MSCCACTCKIGRHDGRRPSVEKNQEDQTKTAEEWLEIVLKEKMVFHGFPEKIDYYGRELEFCKERANADLFSRLKENFKETKVKNEEFDAALEKSLDRMKNNTKDFLYHTGVYKMSLKIAKDYIESRKPEIISKLRNDEVKLKEILYKKTPSDKWNYSLPNAEQYMRSYKASGGSKIGRRDKNITTSVEDKSLYGAELDDKLDDLVEEFYLSEIQKEKIDKLKKAKVLFKK